MEKTNFEKLRVYRLAESLADSVWRIVLNWDYLAKVTVGKQLIRAADSIGANLAEGTGRGTSLDNRRFIRIARGSLYETKHWLRRAHRRSLLNPQQVDNLNPLMNELSPMLNAYFRAVDRAAKAGKIKTQSTKNKAQRSRGTTRSSTLQETAE